MNQNGVFERSDASGSIRKLMGILHTKYIEIPLKLAIFNIFKNILNFLFQCILHYKSAKMA